MLAHTHTRGHCSKSPPCGFYGYDAVAQSRARTLNSKNCNRMPKPMLCGRFLIHQSAINRFEQKSPVTLQMEIIIGSARARRDLINQNMRPRDTLNKKRARNVCTSNSTIKLILNIKCSDINAITLCASSRGSPTARSRAHRVNIYFKCKKHTHAANGPGQSGGVVHVHGAVCRI